MLEHRSRHSKRSTVIHLLRQHLQLRRKLDSHRPRLCNYTKILPCPTSSMTCFNRRLQWPMAVVKMIMNRIPNGGMKTTVLKCAMSLMIATIICDLHGYGLFQEVRISSGESTTNIEVGVAFILIWKAIPPTMRVFLCYPGRTLDQVN